MEGKFAGKRLHSLPFLIVEASDGIILKRGPTEIHVQGDYAQETVLLILTATSGKGQSPEEICLQFPKPDRNQIIQLLDEMVTGRLLVPADNITTKGHQEESNQDVFYWTADKTREQVVQTLSDLHIAIAGVNKLTQKISLALSAMGVSHLTVVDDPTLRNLDFFDEAGEMLMSDFGETMEFTTATDFLGSHNTSRCIIGTSDFGSQSFLLPWNAECVRRGIHFMPVYLQDMIGYAGPLVLPGETACLECLRMRQNAHLQNKEFKQQVEDQMQRGQSIAAVHPAMISVLAETIVFELCHFYGALPDPRPGRLIKINLPAGVTESKRVLKIPRCPVCSTFVGSSTIQIRKLTPLPD